MTRMFSYSVKPVGAQEWVSGFQFWAQGSYSSCKSQFESYKATGDMAADCGYDGTPIEVRIDDVILHND